MLTPLQVTTYWSWDDVHAADNYLAEIEGLYAQNATNIEYVWSQKHTVWFLIPVCR